MTHNSTRAAFYDLDGTLVSSNVVLRYAFYAKNLPSKTGAVLRCSKLLLGLPVLIGLELYSRRLFNEIFYREYQGMRKEWLHGLAEMLFEKVVRPSIYPGAHALLEADRKQGNRLVLLTGELDFALGPVMRYFGFDDLISNSLIFEDGAATGEIVPPLIAEREKSSAIARYGRRHNVELAQSKAYSDSFSDMPMLEAVGTPIAVHPDRRLKRAAIERGWPVLDLKRGNHVRHYRADPRSGIAGI